MPSEEIDEGPRAGADPPACALTAAFEMRWHRLTRPAWGWTGHDNESGAI